MAADSEQSGSKREAAKPPEAQAAKTPKPKTLKTQAPKTQAPKTPKPQATVRAKPARRATSEARPSEPAPQAAPPETGGPQWQHPYPPASQPSPPGQVQPAPPPYWYPPAAPPSAWPPPPGPWGPPPGAWGTPVGWPPPAPVPWPAPGAWPPPSGTWPAPPPPPAVPPPQPAAPLPPQSTAWPQPPAPAAWAPVPGSAAQWAPPFAPPWGYGYPLPLAEPSPPSDQHPPARRRPLASLAERAAPRLYAAGWILSLGGLVLLVALIAAASAGLSGGIDRSIRLVVGETSLVALTAGLWSAAIAQSRQRRADGWEDYFGPSPLLATGLLVALSGAVAAPLGEALDRLGLEMASSVEMLLALLVNLACYATLTHWLGVRTGALTWSDVARPQHLAPTRQDLLSAFWSAARPATTRLRRIAREVGLGAGLAVPAMIGTLVLLALVTSLLRLQDVPPSGDSYEILTDFDFWIILVSLAVVAPIGEEIFFRGLITNAWARSLARKEALLRATVLFASVHILNNELDPNALGLTLRLAAMAVVVRLPVAWLLCWAYTSQRSIIASISLHGVYNGSLVLLSWWAWHHPY